MHRTNIYLTTPQVKALKLLGKKNGLTNAEMIRRAVDAYLKAERK